MFKGSKTAHARLYFHRAQRFVLAKMMILDFISSIFKKISHCFIPGWSRTRRGPQNKTDGAGVPQVLVSASYIKLVSRY